MTSKKSTLNVAMIGQGFMGRAHSNAFHQVNHFFDTRYDLKRKVICGRDQARLQQMAARWGWQETAEDWRAIVERRDIDLVDIGTPNHLHSEISLAAAGAGKMVLCEKPLAMSTEEAQRMAAAVRGRPNLVWFNYRRVPAIALSKQLVDEGRVGQVFHYRGAYLQSWGPDPARAGSWRFRPSEAGSGAMGDLLSHSIDLALLLNGIILEVSAMTQTFSPGREVDDAVLLLAKFANGSIGSFEATRYAIGCRNRNAFEIHGSKGMIGFNLEDLNRLQFFDSADPSYVQGARNLLVTSAEHPYANKFWPPGHLIGYEHTFIATLADFLNALQKGEPFHPNFDDGLRVQRVLDAVSRSARQGAWTKIENAVNVQ